jgi:signal transduction histidine kinase
MSRDGGPAERTTTRRLDPTLATMSMLLALFTGIVAAVPIVAPAIVNDRLDLAVHAAATLVSGAVAAWNWARGRVSRDPSALLRGSAFAILALLNLLTLGVLLADAEAAFGMSRSDPGQLPLIAGVIARGASAVLLVLAGFLALQSFAPAERPIAMLIAPAVLVGIAIAIAALAQDRLPIVAPTDVLRDLMQSPAMPLTPGSAPLLVLAQGLIGSAFLLAAVLAHRSYRLTGRSNEAFLAAGLLIGAFSQVHLAIHPGSFADLVTTGDLLWLAFYGVLLAGLVAESRDDLSELREANVEVRRLAEAQLANAALEERARIAREIHDGLAQDLWYAKLKQSRLGQMVGADGDASILSTEVADAIDAALAEARRAVVAMRPGTEAGHLPDMITRQVDDFADRFAVRAEVTTAGPPPQMDAKSQAEVLRIVQEALNNIRKHADATVVRVGVETDGDLRITVSDNGRGFRPDVRTGGFGLDSMRQRAELIGARLSVSSEPRNGTRVELVMPAAGRRETDGS